MAKNRAQLEEEAKELGIDVSGLETNRQFQDAIAAKQKENSDGEASANSTETVGPDNTANQAEDSGDRDFDGPPALTDKSEKENQLEAEPLRTPPSQSDQEDIDAPLVPEEEPKKGKKRKKVAFSTDRLVKFSINGEQFEGTEFELDADVVESRKAMLRARYGLEVIKE